MPKTKGVAPGLLLMPAREYEWDVKNQVEVRIPLRGSISSLQGISRGELSGNDNFSLFEDNVFQLWEIVRVMFAASKYPALEDNECLNVVALELEDNELVVYGQLIESV